MLATKTVAPERLREVAALGATLFGENRVQEALPKQVTLADLGATWHMIGHLQTNKVRDALRFAVCVQSVDRPSLVQALQTEGERLDRTVDIHVEVNVSGEAGKHGCRPDDLAALLDDIAGRSHLRVRGLMTIGALSDDETHVRKGFALLRDLRDKALASNRIPADATALSMGMSTDLDWAIAEGSTLVRVGSAVFGARI